MNDLTAYFDQYHKVDAYRIIYPDENVVRFLVAHFSQSERAQKKILDLGCGSGRHLILLCELGFKTFGIDFSEVGLSYSKEWLNRRGFNAELMLSDITELNYPDGMFDGVIEHAALVYNSWESILSACRECRRVLKAGGVGFFLLKRKEDCAFNDAKEVAKNTFLVEEAVYMSKKHRASTFQTTFRAFSLDDINTMFAEFSKVRIHTWDLSFKAPHIDAQPGERRTAYWIVLVQK